MLLLSRARRRQGLGRGSERDTPINKDFNDSGFGCNDEVDEFFLADGYEALFGPDVPSLLLFRWVQQGRAWGRVQGGVERPLFR